MNRFGSAPDHEEDAQATTNEQRNDVDMLAMAVVAVTNSRRNRRRVPQPMYNSILTGSMGVEEILNGHEDDEFIRPLDYTAVQHLINEHFGAQTLALSQGGNLQLYPEEKQYYVGHNKRRYVMMLCYGKLGYDRIRQVNVMVSYRLATRASLNGLVYGLNWNGLAAPITLCKRLVSWFDLVWTGRLQPLHSYVPRYVHI
ncbi:hypothetical protein TIFTF001_042365 [Ficus carica]|uniref:Uncharacterized protein n=1 Tax=Ficus carica TaxID=3494 RepID=A0AA87ZMM8_FICCA|nr:hypothetical protein TIFTF001_042365 [Ficus carica]